MPSYYPHTNESRALSINTLKFIIATLDKRNLLPLLSEPEAIVFGGMEQAIVAGMTIVAEMAARGEDVSRFIIHPSEGPTPSKEPPPSPV